MKEKYTVPYNVGMVGLIYNTTMVEEAPDSWSVMWDEKYKDNILGHFALPWVRTNKANEKAILTEIETLAKAVKEFY